ncbi:MAG: LamG-like jellyroll fold domain-containing protein [Lentisphaeria bacterium]
MTTANRTSDFDGDGLSDLYEFLAGTDPTKVVTIPRTFYVMVNGVYTQVTQTTEAGGFVDADGNPIDDAAIGGGAAIVAALTDAAIDSDGDGLANLNEQLFNTLPNNPDTDDDGEPDGAEVAAGTNPLNSLRPFVYRELAMADATQFVQLPDHASYSWSTLTFEAWVKPTGSAGTLLRRQLSSGEDNYHVELLADGKLRFAFNYINLGGQTVAAAIDSEQAIAANEWSHVAVSLGPSAGLGNHQEVRFYINGEAVGVSAPIAMTGLYRGASDETAAVQLGGFAGSMFDARLWALRRSAAQIAASMGEELTGAEPGLVGWFRFDDNGATVENFHFQNDWLTGWENAGVLTGGAIVQASDVSELPGVTFDSDNDGIADWWELGYFGNLATANRTSDFDGDGLSDLYEFLVGTNPTKAVTVPRTFYTMVNGVYTQVTQTTEAGDFVDAVGNPIADADLDDGAADVAAMTDAAIDTDGDGLSNADEAVWTTHPGLADTDDDGISDLTEINVTRTNPIDPLSPYRNRALDLTQAEHTITNYAADGSEASQVLEARLAPYALVEDFAEMSSLNNYTMELWFKLADGSGDSGVLLQKTVATPGLGVYPDFKLYLDNGQLKFDYVIIGNDSSTAGNQLVKSVAYPDARVCGWRWLDACRGQRSPSFGYDRRFDAPRPPARLPQGRAAG